MPAFHKSKQRRSYRARAGQSRDGIEQPKRGCANQPDVRGNRGWRRRKSACSGEWPCRRLGENAGFVGRLVVVTGSGGLLPLRAFPAVEVLYTFSHASAGLPEDDRIVAASGDLFLERVAEELSELASRDRGGDEPPVVVVLDDLGDWGLDEVFADPLLLTAALSTLANPGPGQRFSLVAALHDLTSAVQQQILLSHNGFRLSGYMPLGSCSQGFLGSPDTQLLPKDGSEMLLRRQAGDALQRVHLPATPGPLTSAVV